MCKKQLLFALALIASLLVTAQSGQKWATGLNGLSTGDALGSSNNMPLIFKTNNTQQMVLNTKGGLQLNSLIGSSNSVLFADANGNLFPLPAGNSNQVLFGNGLWGNLPEQAWKNVTGGIAPTNSAAKVGIGNTAPQYNLDVTGNVHISTDLIVNNGITLGTKNTLIAPGANGELLVQSDFISSGISTLRGGLNVTGTSIFSGSGSFSGNVDIAQNITFAGGQPGISYISSPKGNIISMLANTSLQGDVIVTGVLTAGGINATGSNLNVTTPAVFTGGVTLSSLGGSSGGGFVSVDSAGNLKVNPIIGTGGGGSISLPPCTTQAPWMIEGNKLGNVANAVIGTCDNHDFVMEANGTSYIWLKTTGRLGLNNSAPNAMFDITASGTNDGLNINNSSNPIFNVANNGKTIINVTPASEPGDAFVINDVFTGTQVTNFKVKTTGQVYAREIFVQLGVLPDYVFKNDYKLMPLSEVEKYYKANLHLPEVPSEKEVKENGLNVGDMNAVLLKKIEELTLYTVELEKKLKALEEKISK